jgi:predicted hotdog family 3-hydroxylacyl-ACP dehydratase
MMRGASGDECGNLLGQDYNRPAREAGVLKKPREATLHAAELVPSQMELLISHFCFRPDRGSVFIC